MCTVLVFSSARFASGNYQILRAEQVAMVKNKVLRALIRRCLQDNPQDRPSMEDVIGELEKLV